MAVSVEVDGLAVVAIYAEAYHVIFHHSAVRVDIVVWVGVLREGHGVNSLMFWLLLTSVTDSDVSVCAVMIGFRIAF